MEVEVVTSCSYEEELEEDALLCRFPSAYRFYAEEGVAAPSYLFRLVTDGGVSIPECDVGASVGIILAFQHSILLLEKLKGIIS